MHISDGDMIVKRRLYLLYVGILTNLKGLLYFAHNKVNITKDK